MAPLFQTLFTLNHKPMKVLQLSLSLMLVFLFGMQSIHAQMWSDSQKEVWKAVTTYNDSWKSGDSDAFMSNFHKDYKGWHYSSPIPIDKSSTGKYVKFGMENREVIFSHIEPVSIQVFDDFAIVNYLFHNISKRGDKTNSYEGRWTDVLKKESGKWMLVADHGGSLEDDD